MDQELLVKSGQELIRLLDNTVIKPRVAMWVRNSDLDIWRLWIVPAKHVGPDQFFRIVSLTISDNRSSLPSLDISAIELKNAKDAPVAALMKAVNVDGGGIMRLASNTFNGYYLPDGIALRVRP